MCLHALMECQLPTRPLLSCEDSNSTDVSPVPLWPPAQRGLGSIECELGGWGCCGAGPSGGWGCCGRGLVGRAPGRETQQRLRGFQAPDERGKHGAACDPLGTFRLPLASHPHLPALPSHGCLSSTPRSFWVLGFKVSLGFKISRHCPRHA